MQFWEPFRLLNRRNRDFAYLRNSAKYTNMLFVFFLPFSNWNSCFSEGNDLQLCGVRGAGNAAAQALYWQAKRGLSYILAFESVRERNAAIMLARRYAFDCNVSTSTLNIKLLSLQFGNSDIFPTDNACGTWWKVFGMNLLNFYTELIVIIEWCLGCVFVWL